MNDLKEKINPLLKEYLNFFNKDSLSHGYLISGENGLGKKDLVRVLSESILCKNSNELFEACGECNASKLMQSGNHPDYHFIEEEVGSKIIKIGQLRGNKKKNDSHEGIVNSMFETPLVSASKVFVINNAHLMNDESQNFILKILEEPPKESFIFLISSNPFLLKKTLLSRLSHLQIKFPDLSSLKEYFSEKRIEIDERDYELLKGEDLVNFSAVKLEDLRESWEDFSKDLVNISSYKEIEKISSKWDDDSVQEKLIWLSKIILESFKKRLDSNFKATFLSSDLNLDRKSLIDLSEIFKNIQNILIDLNSGVKLNNKIQIKSLLSNLN